MRHLFDKVHVFGTTADFVVTDEGAKGRAPEGAELFLVDLLEQRRLSFLVALSSLIFRRSPVDVCLQRYCRPVQVDSSCWNSGACITALSCVEMRRSISAMRASMLAERLSEMVTVPAMTSRTSSPMMSLARACSTSVLATLLRATMSSSRPRPSVLAACG
jgi:hypothetical protein